MHEACQSELAVSRCCSLYGFMQLQPAIAEVCAAPQKLQILLGQKLTYSG